MCGMKLAAAVNLRWSVTMGGNENNLGIWKGKEESKSSLESGGCLVGLGQHGDAFKKMFSFTCFRITFMLF